MMNKQIQSDSDVFTASNLTRSQFLIWTGQKLNSQTALYNMALTYRLDGNIDVAAFQKAFQTLVDESDVMRSVVEEDNGIPVQRVLARFDYTVQILDFRQKLDPLQASQTWAEHRCQSNFDLERCLFESVLIRASESQWVWYMNQHHLLTDGWSVTNLYKRVAELYGLSINNALDDARPLPTFKTYLDHEHKFRQTEAFHRATAYWQKKSEIPVDTPRPYGKTISKTLTRTERVFCELDAERSAKLKAIAAEDGIKSLSEDITLFNIFASLLFTWLYRSTNSKELSIGTFAHNRSTKELKQSIGMFIELFPLFTTIEKDETFFSLIQKVGKEAFGFLGHAKPGTGNPNLEHPYGAILNFINASFSDFNGIPMTSRWVHPGHGDRGHSLRLQVHDFDNSGCFQLHFDFNTAVFDESLRAFATQHFLLIVDAFIEDRNQALQTIDLMGVKSRHEIMVDFNKTHSRNMEHSPKTFIDIFEHHAQSNSSAIAVEDQGQTLNYATLNARANNLAYQLQATGFLHGEIAGICCERSIEMVVTVLAVLKAGGAYVPLDPTYPSERIQMMLADTKATISLISAEFAPLFPEKLKTLNLNTDITPLESSTEISLDKPSPTDRAYIIYTSGSTGKPKGVVIQHQALCNYLTWAQKQYLGDSKFSFPLFSNFSADLTVTSIFLPLISGGRIVIYREEKNGPDLSILKVIDENKVDILKLTPAHLALVSHKKAQGSKLKTIIVGGEDLRTGLARKALDIFGRHLKIYNEYGPTETTVGCMIHRFDEDKDIASSVPIGKPVDNMQIYILDEAMHPVPYGFEGEIYISGLALAEGYLNRPELTVERFVDNIFEPGSKMYRSGDIARWASEGVLEFVGRKDEQVKIRGFRIELGEIEAALEEFPKIGEAAVKILSPKDGANDADNELTFCKRCGLASNHPDSKLDENHICKVCHDYELQKKAAHYYFKDKSELLNLFSEVKSNSQGKYDCLMLLSGGKDSTYVLYQLLEMGLNPLVFSMDNGYISEQAKNNMQTVIEDLGLDFVWGTTPAMNEIFVDSLKRFSNVCNGCYKVIYTLSVKLALEKGIRHIVTGLTRGQFFETRVSQMFKNKIIASSEIDETIIEARKAYHRMDDAVSRCMDVSLFQDDEVFEEIQFIDYFRYTDVELQEMLDFLDQKTAWTRPTDTGRSTNCLINEAGIYVHKKERGFHNYALPYSWDVRLGHKQRGDALEELDDDIDEVNVKQILNEIGYQGQETFVLEKQLAAYYTSSQEIPSGTIREFLSQRLPIHMLPSHFVRIEKMPLNKTGKVNKNALPIPEEKRSEPASPYIPPRNEIEKIMTEIWCSVMRLEKIGVEDNFFDIGGDSILNIQIISRANQLGIKLTPGQLFSYPTIAGLSAVTKIETNTSETTQPASGTVMLTPIQNWFFEQALPDESQWNMALKVELEQKLNTERWQETLVEVLCHHDAFRLRFKRDAGLWKQAYSDSQIGGTAVSEIFSHYDLSLYSDNVQQGKMKQQIEQIHRSLNLQAGPTFKSALFQLGDEKQILFLCSHHLVIDGVSWLVLLEDFETVYTQLNLGQKAALAPRTQSFQYWSEQLLAYSQSTKLRQEIPFWQNLHKQAEQLPTDIPATATQELSVCLPINIESSAQTLSLSLSKRETDDLLKKAPSTYRTQVNELLLAALAPVITEWSGSETLHLNMEGHGREEIAANLNISRTVGWFTSIFPIRLDISELQGLGEIIASVKEQYRKMPNHGIGYGILRYSGQLSVDKEGDFPSESEAQYGHKEPQILFNYLGQTDQLVSASSLFSNVQVSASHASESPRRHLIEINAYVAKDQLEVHWTYSKQVHHQETITALAKGYMQKLSELIKLCLSPNAGKLTPSDFPLANLSTEKMDKLSKLLGK